MIGLLFFIVGGAWLLYGVPFEDPWQDWMIRSAVFVSGLFLVIVSFRKSNKAAFRGSLSLVLQRLSQFVTPASGGQGQLQGYSPVRQPKVSMN